ncbi:uncharacterized protein LOC120330958 [Styela clava]
MTSQSPILPLALLRQKPQAKLASPVSRNLFGASEASVVSQMLNEVLVSERRRGYSNLNFDIHNEKPAKHEQQENISDADKTPEPRRRYYWKQMKSGEAPEFYSRRYKGKKLLMPVDLSNCSPDSSTSRSRSVRRSLNGYLRSPSSEIRQKNIIRPSSTSRLEPSPLRTLSSKDPVDSPLSFDSEKIRLPLPILRPLPLHASTENAFTVKVFSPAKSTPANVRFTARSPLSQRGNQERGVRALDFSSSLQQGSSVFAPRFTSDVTNSNNSSISTSTPEIMSTPSSEMRVPAAPTPLKQLKLTEMVTMRKPRSPALKARKRLNLSEDETSSAKTPRLTHPSK